MQSTLPRWVKSSACEGVVVLGVDDGVERLVAAAFDLPGGDEAGVDRVAELRDDDEVLNRRRRGLGLVGERHQFGDR